MILKSSLLAAGLLVLLSLFGSPAAARGALVGGMFADCRGARTESPTVILEAGAFGTSADWDFVLAGLAAGGRVCAYDRAGVGRSPPGPGGLDALSRARQLAALLDQLQETRPVILIGHSNGALYAEAFAGLFPERVAGLVYINGVGSDDLDDPLLLRTLVGERRLSNLMVTAARFGVAPVVAAAMIEEQGLSGDAAAHKRRALTCFPCLKVGRDEDRLIIPSLAEVRALGDKARHIPTVIIVGEPYPRARLARGWRAAETAPARRADRSWVLDAPGASHVSPLARDGDYIDAAVGWLRREAGSLPGADILH